MKKAIAMKCTQEDWDSIKDRIPKEIKVFQINKFKKHFYIVLFEDKTITNGTLSDRESCIIHETFNAKIFLDACGIELKQKFEITKEQILELKRRGNQLVDEKLTEFFPEVFKKELEVGKWYKNKYNCLFCITEKDDEKYRSYGFMQGKWKDYGEFTNEDDLSSNTEATPQEVETALIREAKKKGFLDGAHFKSPVSNWNDVCNGVFRYNSELNELYSNGTCVFSNGIFATIIETITIQEAEKLLNKKIV